MAGNPLVGKGVYSQQFDFFGVMEITGFNFFGALIAQEAKDNGDDVALMFVAHKEEMLILLGEAFFGQVYPGITLFEAHKILFGFEEGGYSGGNFDEVIEGARRGSIEEFEELAGGEGGGGAGDGAGSGMMKV